MNYDYEIQNLKRTVENLQQTVIQMARNNTPVVGKVDNTANGLNQAGADIERNQANIDYISMMTDVELPE